MSGKSMTAATWGCLRCGAQLPELGAACRACGDIPVGRWVVARPLPVVRQRTRLWELRSTAGAFLGYVRWSTAWRRYILDPEATAVFDALCLHALAEFLDAQTATQRAGWRSQRASGAPSYTASEREAQAARAASRAELGRPA